jgi:hypothetical protein
MTRKCLVLASLLAMPFLVTSCDAGRARLAYGDVNRIIVVVPDELWTLVRDSVERALEPHIFTVRDERTFEATQVAPDDPNWLTLRQFRQILVIGAAEHSWVEPVLNGETVTPPAIVDRADLWARNQIVTALVLPADRLVQSTYEQLPTLFRHFDDRYRQHVLHRMYASGADSALQRQLAATAGFSLLPPQIYRHEMRDDAHVFRTTAEMGAQVIRTVTVVSRPGAAVLSPDQIMAWRDSLAMALYNPPHQTLRERFETRERAGAVEVQSSWSAQDNGWPFGGPFVARAIPCPAQDRTYLADAWVFAPGRPKYEYIIQFEILLDNFACAP